MRSTPPHFLNVFSIKDVLLEARALLSKITDSAALDAELLLAYCLKKNRTYLHTWSEKRVEENQLNCYRKLIEKRLTDYPIAYLIGHKAFWTLDLLVTPDVLIPRPETELLVEAALERIESIRKPSILDLGTGSGAIALSIASERSDAKIIASDFSNAALLIAKKNAQYNSLDNNVLFIESNWFSNIKAQKFDLIVSNPPYIAPDDPHLKQTIRHEPLEALSAKLQGMEGIERIIKDSPDFLKEKSWLIIEHGYQQGREIKDLFVKQNFKRIETRVDLNQNDRVTLAQLR